MTSESIKNVIKSCDMSIEIKDAYVVFCNEKYEDFVLSKARYFTNYLIDIGDWINDQISRPNPFNDGANMVKIVYYGHNKEATKICRRLKGDGALVMLTKRPNSDSTDCVDNIGSSRRSLRNQINEDPCYTTGETMSVIRALKRTVEYLEMQVVDINKKVASLSEKVTELSEDRDGEGEVEITGTKSNHRIAELASSILEKKRLSKKVRSWQDNDMNMKLTKNTQFINAVKKWKHNDLNENQLKEIRNTLLNGSSLASKVSIKLGMIIFGEEMLKRALLGVNGEFTRKPRQFERNEIIPVEKENILRDVLMLIDDSIFTDGHGWNQLVRGPINQKGREITDLNPNKRKAHVDDSRSRKRIHLSSGSEDSHDSNSTIDAASEILDSQLIDSSEEENSREV